MEAGKIRALGIAPYEGMKSIMLKLAQERDDIDLTVFVGDLEKGAEIVKKNFNNDYDVIISRGGTAELVGKITNIPVIEISLSVYDILRAMKLAENYSERYAIVGFPGITGSAHLLCDLLQYKIDIFTIHDENEVQVTLKDLKNRGYRMVLCDMIANTTAKKLGLNAILITSGNESIISAFDQAIKLCSSYAHIKESNRLLESIICGYNCQTAIFDSSQNLLFSTLTDESGDQILNLLKKELPEALASETHKSFKNIEGELYSITSKRLLSNHHEYTAYYVSTNSIPIAGSKYGIQYSNRKDVEDRYFNSFYSVTGDGVETQDTLEQMTQSPFPIMITGEEGTGKGQAAGSVYTKSALSHNPLITINCSMLNDKSWSFLVNHYNSPFNDNNNTIYIKNIGALPETRRKHLLSFMIDLNLCKRNRMIFSCVCPKGETMPAVGMEFVNLLSCITLHLQPLRERAEELPTLSSLYLNKLNLNLAKQIIGFEPEGMELLQDFDWPYNHTQLKRLLNELAIITVTPYITTVHVASLLEKERRHTLPSCANSSCGLNIDINRTLEEINQDIIHITLKDTNGNQSSAAKRLGISRTTLWRYLK